MSQLLSQGTSHSGQPRSGFGLRAWPGSAGLGAAAALEGPLGQPCPPEQPVQLCGFWHCRNDSNGTNPREELDLGGCCRESNLSSCHGHEVQLPFPLSFYLLKNMMKMYVSSQIFRAVAAWQNTLLCLFSHHFTWGTRRHTEFTSVVLFALR